MIVQYTLATIFEHSCMLLTYVHDLLSFVFNGDFVSNKITNLQSNILETQTVLEI